MTYPVRLVYTLRARLKGGSTAMGGLAALSRCPLYVFDPNLAIPSYIGLVTPYTGRVGMAFATWNGSVGLASGVIDGPVTNSSEAARTDLDLLTWNTITLDVVSASQLTDATFDGVVAYFILDDVYVYDVDMGAV